MAVVALGVLETLPFGSATARLESRALAARLVVRAALLAAGTVSPVIGASNLRTVVRFRCRGDEPTGAVAAALAWRLLVEFLLCEAATPKLRTLARPAAGGCGSTSSSSTRRTSGRSAAENGLLSGKSSTRYAAVAIYAASLLCNEKKTQREVADVAQVTEVIIRYQKQIEALGIHS